MGDKGVAAEGGRVGVEAPDGAATEEGGQGVATEGGQGVAAVRPSASTDASWGHGAAADHPSASSAAGIPGPLQDTRYMGAACLAYDIFQKDDVDGLNFLVYDSLKLVSFISSKHYQDEMRARLLHNAVEFDAVKCADILLTGDKVFNAVPRDVRDRQGRTSLHIAAENLSTKCINLLLSKEACTDIMSFGNNYFALQLALDNIRSQVELLQPCSTQDLIAILRSDEEIISSIGLLAQKTSAIGQLAYKYAITGSVPALAMLLLVIPDSILLKPHGSEATSIYESVWNEALLASEISDTEGVIRRSALFSVIELLHHFMDSSGSYHKIEKISSQETCSTKLYAIKKDDPGLLTEVVKRFKNEASQYLCKEKFTLDMMDNQISKRFLYLACQNDAVNCARLLLEGDDGIVAVHADETDMLGRTPLHVSAKAYSEKCIELLLSKGARTDIQLGGPDGPCPLEVMLTSPRVRFKMPKDISLENHLFRLESKDLGTLKLLAEQTKELQYIACRLARKGETTALALLHLLAPKKITKTMTTAMSHGKKNTVTIYGCIADEVSSTDEHSRKRREILIDVLDMLNHFGATLFKDEKKIVKNFIIKAAMAGDSDLVKRLLLWDTDAHAASRAVEKDDVLSLQSKVKAFSAASILRPNSTSGNFLYLELSTMLLHVACKHDASECANILLKGDSKHRILPTTVDAEDCNGWTPLHSAALAHSRKCTELLLSKNARTNVRSAKDKHIALETAITSYRSQIHWSPANPIIELLRCLKNMDLTSVKLLSEKTAEVGQVAYNYAMDGRVQEFAMLFVVCKDRVLEPVSILKDDIMTEEAIHDSVVKKMLAIEDSSTASYEEKEALGSILRLHWADKGERPVDIEHIILPPVQGAKSRINVSEYADQNKESFMIETEMPDQKISLELTKKGYKFITLLVRSLLSEFSSQRCWDGEVPWSKFVMVDGEIQILQRGMKMRPRGLGLLMMDNLQSLISFLEKYFCRDKKGLISKYPPYLKHFLDMLKDFKVFNDLVKLRIESHMVFMDSDLRIVLIILLKRFSDCFKIEDYSVWCSVMEVDIEKKWYSNVEFTPVYKEVIKNGKDRGEAYSNVGTVSAFRLTRDVAMHPPAANILARNHGLELLIASKTGNLVANILGSYIVKKVDISQVLSCVLRPSCTDAHTQLIALLKQKESKNLSAGAEANTGAATGGLPNAGKKSQNTKGSEPGP